MNIIELTIAKVIDNLSSGAFDAFIDAIEGTEFEAKVTLNDLSQDRHKLELAKDVSSFANSAGGVLVVGLRTTKEDEISVEAVKEVRPYSSTAINIQQISDVLGALICPSIPNISIRWYPSSKDSSIGLVGIHIPPQPHAKKPFLVTRATDESGIVRGNLCAIYERAGPKISARTAAELQQLIQVGSRNEELLQKLTNIEKILEPLRGAPALNFDPNFDLPRASTERALPRHIDTAILEAELGEMPTFALAATPLGSLEYPDFFSSATSPIARLIGQPPEIRNGGFSIDGGAPARIHQGRSWRSLNTDEHRILDLTTRGKLVFCAPGDDSFLCWGRNQRSEKPRINPIVLCESVYLFVELVRKLQAYSTPLNVGTAITLRLERLKSASFETVLAPGGMSPYGQGAMSTHAVPSDRFEHTETWGQGVVDAPRLSYLVVSKVYEWLGFTHDNIPYVDRHQEPLALDIPKLKSL